MTSVDSNFNFLCGRPHGAGPPPQSTCVHLSLIDPLCVDVINGWPLNLGSKLELSRLKACFYVKWPFLSLASTSSVYSSFYHFTELLQSTCAIAALGLIPPRLGYVYDHLRRSTDLRVRRMRVYALRRSCFVCRGGDLWGDWGGRSPKI